jgi:hypothetical protein
MDLRSHMITHSEDRPHQCTHKDCNSKFKRGQHLIVHARTHTGEKPFKCHLPDCNRTFAQSSNRNTHEKFYHDKTRKETYLKKKEEWMVKFLTRNKIAFDRELVIDYRKCGEQDTWARLDFVLYKEDHIIILSVDEFQHIDYEVVCDVARMSKVVCSIRCTGDMRPIIWLRFNPDYFSVNGEKIKIKVEDREEVLLNCIDNSVDMLVDGKDVMVYYLFYDLVEQINGNRVAEVTLDPDYDELWKPTVIDAIY